MAVSGEAPEHPVASRKSGNVFERRLIEDYISQNGTDPVNGEELSSDDLIDLKQSRVVKPRPPTLTSIPALLATFQNEWDALILEAYQLKQQLSETRQELSTALYYNESAQRVIARLQKERDQARDALSRVSGLERNGGHATENGGDAMQVDGKALPATAIETIKTTQANLMATRRKRPVPDGWATADDVQTFEPQSASDLELVGARSLASNATGSLFLSGSAGGAISTFDSQQGTVSPPKVIDESGAAILGSAWCGEHTISSTSRGAVVLALDGAVQASFEEHAGPATAVDVHPSGELFVSVGTDKSYVLYDFASRKALTQVYGDTELTTVAFHPDGNLLAAGAVDGSIRLYNVLDSQLAHTFPPASTPGAAISALSFSENGTWLAAASAGSSAVTVWDLRKLSALKTLDVGTAVTGLAWDYTGQFLAAAGPGGVVVSAYTKSTKAWSEPLRKALVAVDVQWAANAKSLIVLGSEGTVTVLGA